MKAMRRKVFLTAGYNTVSLGPGRPEFHPRKQRPGLEHYLKEAGRGSLAQIGGGSQVDECVVGNFMAARFNRQGNLAAFFPMIDPALLHKPALRVEGACASGGLALLAGVKAVLAGSAEVVLVIGVEVQNPLKAVYGADVLAGAAWFQERKAGQAYFFPGQFSDRAGAYFARYGRERSRRALARWYRNAIENARLCPTAQEHHNRSPDLEALALSEPDPQRFLEHLNSYDCSKVSDGACALAVASEAGLRRIGIPRSDSLEVMGFSHLVDDLTRPPSDPTALDTTRLAVQKALAAARVNPSELGTVETHDCFTIAGLLAVEAIGLAQAGEGPDYLLSGSTARDGELPFNTTGGLIGWGHPTGATGVHQAVTIWEQLTGRAGASQIALPPGRPFALSVNMGGNDKTLAAIVYCRAG